MNLLREYVKTLLGEASEGFKIMIPPPPSFQERIKELPSIKMQKDVPTNEDSMQGPLDTKVVQLFNLIVTSAGHNSHKELIEKFKNEIKPSIKFHKKHFNSLRPNELASLVGFNLDTDYLKSAQSPSYPSGHAAQAYYMAHKLKDIFPQLESSFYNLASMVASSRVDRGVHFPSDITAGIMLADKLYQVGKKVNI